ncbi:glycosyltransferase [Paenibacillus aceris]|uniref:Glycosyltransferase involved in cell wall biosynthesis n=1 Tax=Paenibacillus aceris TaxID=869555 RepID=A0ABS4I816_9BACL|nr:glycosyltransferase involved in cell wall biosynthesis [Paenibacillus aceris]NHW33259.1 glycosyltransferase [Paenibacillus aceris]
MESIVVSIIVPVYNAELYIIRCLQSIGQQTWQDIEVIIIDDGSTDNSLLLIHQFVKNDTRFHVYSQPNKGPSSARNSGMDKVNGQYIIFVDADDYIANSAIENMMVLAKNYSNVMVLCDNYEIWPDRMDRRVLFHDKKDKILHKNDVISAITIGRAGLVCGKLISVDLIRGNQTIKFDEDIKMSEDQVFFLTIAAHASNFFYIDKSLYYYDRRNENSITIQYQNNAFEMQILVQNKLNDIYLTHGLATVESRHLLLLRIKDALWFCINNELSGLNMKNMVTRIKNIEYMLSYQEIKLMLEQIHPKSFKERVMMWAIGTKKGPLVICLQLIQKGIISPLRGLKRRDLKKDV